MVFLYGLQAQNVPYPIKEIIILRILLSRRYTNAVHQTPKIAQKIKNILLNMR